MRVVWVGKVPDAYLLKGLLESEGVEAHLYDENVASIIPLQNSLGFGSVRVAVPEESLAEALAVLEGVLGLEWPEKPKRE